MKKIFVLSMVLVGLLSACSTAEETALVEPQMAIETENVPVDSDAEMGKGGQGQAPNGESHGDGERRFPGFDMEVIASSLGVSVDDLTSALEQNRVNGEIDITSAAASLGVDENDLAEAVGNIQFGRGDGPGNIPPSAIDYAAAAEALQVPEIDLQNAIESNSDTAGMIDFEQAAQVLGVDINKLMGAIGMGGRGMGGPGKGGAENK